MTDHTTTRATRLRRVGCALTIALALGLGLAGTASAATPLNPGVNYVEGELGGWPGSDTKEFTCPAGLGIPDVKTSSPHSDWVQVGWGVWKRDPLQLGIAVHSMAWIVNKRYHVAITCAGPITDTDDHTLG